VPLRVFGDVNNQPDCGGADTLAAYESGVGKLLCGEAEQHFACLAESLTACMKEDFSRFTAVYFFSSKHSKLLIGEGAAFQVRRQAIKASGNVPQVEVRRSRGAKSVKIFFGLLEREEHCGNGGVAGKSCFTQPWFGHYSGLQVAP